MKEPLRRTCYNTRAEVIRAVGWSLLDITEVYKLMAYVAFHKFGRWWYTWKGGGAIILKEYKCLPPVIKSVQS
jgi:hypothetical protein